jgi:CBS domain-containing protein
MAATLGGTMRAPLMAVVFAFELTFDTNALLPTILGCVVAYGFSVVAMPRSILTEKIARRGLHVYREYGVDPLERHFVNEVMTGAVISIPAAMPVPEVQARYFGATQKQRAYPVVDGDRLLGMLVRDELPPEVVQDPVQPVAELLQGIAITYALANETCRAVASRMAALGLERFAVVESAESLKLVGVVSRSDLLKPARQLHEEESRRERFLR